MKLVQIRFSSGQRVPLLVQDDQVAPLPKLVPFIYVQLKLKLRHRAYNTAARTYVLSRLFTPMPKAEIWMSMTPS
ncbi:hypothetical protein [Pseudomonas sp. A-RE-8]|uniref:hypothetical protein n=1 Tax=Pseudomonas sp. A-RE-8 TaxID=2832369 RepID=UPI001CBEB6F1|nr:hypothetical protein [Pseudomonas sp. A-RE-8]